MPQVVNANIESVPESPFTQQPVNPVQPAQPIPMAVPVMPAADTTATSSSVVYASFWKRFVASLIDGVLVGVCVGVLSSVFGFSGDGSTSMSYGSPLNFLGWFYYVFMLVKYGATLGKMAMHLRVQDAETGANLTVVTAILREIVGKFLSAIVLGLGYLWMLWDPKKQTWHDKIARSVVVETK